MSRVHGSRDTATYLRLVRLARPEAKHIVTLYGLSLLATPLALMTPLPLKIAVDSGIGSHPLPGFLDAVVPGDGSPSATVALFAAAALFVATALLLQVQQLASAALGAYTGERLLLRLRGQLFRHAQRLSLSYHDLRGTADSTYRIQYDAMSIQWIAITGLAPLVTAALTVAGMIYVTARIDWQLMLVALGVAPLLLLLTHAYRGRLRRGWHEAKALESSALSVVQEVLTSLRVVKAFGQEDREQERFLRASSLGMWARIRLSVVEGVFGVLIGLATAAGSAAVLVIGVRHVRAGTITLGELLLVMGYLSQLYLPLQTISRTAGKLQAAMASAERAFLLLDEAPDVPERPRARRLARASGALSFDRVWFAYGDDRPVLRDISFDVDPGACVGVAGATGAGKTTLISLITRFYDPTEGAIGLDGRDLRDYRLADLRAQFAIVLQDPVLFSTSIRENIAYARPGAELDDIMAAARAADVHDFIAGLPDGYETVVGERGMRLSGGERQRISLARAFLKDAPILILDEPTSSVDVRTERSIMTAMGRLMEGRTTFMIAHRTSTLGRCGVRLELSDGRLRRRALKQGSRPPSPAAAVGSAGVKPA